MKVNFTYHGHTIVADTAPPPSPLPMPCFHADGVTVRCDTASMPYLIASAAVFATVHNIRSLVVDGVELKRTN